ncbi:Tetratricopeptide TPR_2 repeat protein [Chloroherpeton thalassium ATCC 35110]|uniref:Tetratricopeptide TPR_2 repeat protein n=2 Tax=Chloroherpeton thalassium TaxID=100716 RepID=B3QTS2_CHLT3|nr:Tetratricopeptide TPR_2 repeat protein [Chloroherpeton thalassium ATCC 35110]
MSFALLFAQACQTTSEVTTPKMPAENAHPDSLAKAFGLLYYKEGLSFLDARLYEKAIGKFREAEPYIMNSSVFHPTDRSTFQNSFGKAFFFSGKNDLAKLRFESAEELNPSNYEAYNNIGYLAFLDKNYERAELFYQKALQINPNDEIAQENLEILHRFQTGDLSWDAFGLYEKADNIENLEEKIRLYTELVEKSPLFYDAQNNLAVALFQAGEFEKALELFQQLTLIVPKYAMGHNNLGFVYLQLGKNSEAIEEFLRATALKPQFTLALTNLATAYYQAGNYTRAKQFAVQILEYDTYNSEARRIMQLSQTMLSAEKATESR